ncbi:MAG: selenide, water dikinase SelD [Betaproteobacteria bacterium TMED156]|nr:MAG: selenide, water dikinase SelD [Betaproteobacteria bacterium TMED156]
MKSKRLTSLSRGGGCGCKIEPKVLHEILKDTIKMPIPDEVIVGINTSDDAAVYQINENQVLIATTDFFTPIVDDPEHFGEIAATNAISDVYAMGGKPIFALAIVCMPTKILTTEQISKILNGGKKICIKAGIPIVGGHTIDSEEPIYGLIVLGLASPENIRKNSNAKIGNKLILGKPIGMGIYSSALKRGQLPENYYSIMISNATQLNSIGANSFVLSKSFAITDVTGFGLAGHAWEIANGSKTDLQIFWNKVPILPGVKDLIKLGFVTGASQRNWESFKDKVVINSSLKLDDRNLIFDPQTSGGLLIAVDSVYVDEILKEFKKNHYIAAEIGEIIERKTEFSKVFVE